MLYASPLFGVNGSVMTKTRPLRPEVLRLVLAALVLLGGIAGARMQGEMGAVALAGGGSAVLCSGAGRINDPLRAPDAHDHAHCAVCPLPGDVPAPGTVLPTRLAASMVYAPETDAQHDAAKLLLTRARGPPQIG